MLPRFLRARFAWSALLAGALAIPRLATAQAPCNRTCDASLRDAFGCCPSASPSPPRAATGQKCASSAECPGSLVCIQYRCQSPPGSSPSTGTGIRVAGTQPGARLYVDERDIGPLPQEVRDLSPGSHRLRVAASDRYAAIEKVVTLAAGELQDQGAVTLKVIKGRVTVSLATAGAQVFLVSGAERRQVPTLPISIDLDTVKSYSLVATLPGYVDYVLPISFDDGQAERSVTIALTPQGAPAAAAGAPFDRAAAAAALVVIADRVPVCKQPDGPTGDGHVSITFAPSGSVVSAIVDQPPFAGTRVGGCVAGKFREAQVPPFAGGNLTIGKRFSVN